MARHRASQTQRVLALFSTNDHISSGSSVAADGSSRSGSASVSASGGRDPAFFDPAADGVARHAEEDFTVSPLVEPLPIFSQTVAISEANKALSELKLTHIETAIV